MSEARDPLAHRPADLPSLRRLIASCGDWVLGDRRGAAPERRAQRRSRCAGDAHGGLAGQVRLGHSRRAGAAGQLGRAPAARRGAPGLFGAGGAPAAGRRQRRRRVAQRRAGIRCGRHVPRLYRHRPRRFGRVSRTRGAGALCHAGSADRAAQSPDLRRRAPGRCSPMPTRAAASAHCCASGWTACIRSTASTATAPATALLAVVGERLQALVPPPNLLGRRGGDEIVALLVDVDGAQRALALAAEVAAAVARPIALDAVAVSLAASVGIAHVPERRRRSRCAAATPPRRPCCWRKPVGRRRAGPVHAGAGAAHRSAPAPGAAPAPRPSSRAISGCSTSRWLTLPGGELVGAEALLRWKDAELGDISPAEFIPIAEQSGLIERVGEWVLREACRQRQLWRQVGLDLPPVAINVSGVQLRERRFVDLPAGDARRVRGRPPRNWRSR